MKRNILIQKIGKYVGLCSNNVFRIKACPTYEEIATIKKENDKFILTVNGSPDKYDYVEECFYHLIPYIAVEREDVVNVCKYFGEKCA